MDIDIRPVRPEDFDVFFRSTERAFSYHPDPAEIEAERRVFEADRSLAAFDGGEIVGTAGAFSRELTVPGGFLPVAGVTGVGVLATHRRRGLLTALMRRQLDDVRGRGEPLAALWASEGPIYGRFGYGVAAWGARFSIERQWTAYSRPHPGGGRLRLVERSEALEAFPSVYERIRPGQPGMLDRSAPWWEVRFQDFEQRRQGAGAFFYALHETEQGAVDGYAVYRVRHAAKSAGGTSLELEELLAASREAYAAIWRYCLDIDLIATVNARHRPVDEPLLFMLSHPRALNFQVADALWVRLVDLPNALSGRGYGARGELVLEVRDAFCPWNEGRFHVEGGLDGAQCRATSARPDLVLDAAALAAAYLGGTSFLSLYRAGGVDEETPGALRRADAMFQAHPAPWCPEVF